MNDDFERAGSAGHAFENLQRVVSDALRPLGTDVKLASLLSALHPDTDNIETDDVFALQRPERAAPSLRELALPKRPNYPETGDRANRELARILNKLAELQGHDPIGDMQRAGTGNKVLHLPVPPELAARQERVTRMAEEGQDLKRRVLDHLTRELPQLFSGAQMMSSVPLQNAIDDLPRKLVDGDVVAKTARDVICEIGAVGKLRHAGYTLEKAVEIQMSMRPKNAPGAAPAVPPA